MKKIIALTVALVIMISGAAAMTYNHYQAVVDIDGIYPGIYIDKKDVSGMSKEEALTYLKENDETRSKEVTIHAGERDFVYPYVNLGYDPNYEELVEEAYQYGRDEESEDRLKIIMDLRVNPLKLESKWAFDPAILDEVVAYVSSETEKEAVNAQFKISEGNVDITPEQKGLAVNKEKFRKDLDENYTEPITLELSDVAPKVVASDFERLKGIIGEYTTNYSSSIQARKENIKLSAKLLDGTVIMPGEQFSFNNTIGRISADTGWHQATVIEDGDFVTGTGGGVCQASSTLYMAAATADMQIDERRNHSRPVNYIPRGLDAAVASGQLDLKFTNTFDFPVYITAKADNDNITFRIIGDDNVKNYQIEIVPELRGTLGFKTVTRNDSSKPAGTSETVQTGYNGYNYTSYKVKKKDGEVLSTTPYLNSYYPARDRVVSVGTRAAASGE